MSRNIINDVTQHQPNPEPSTPGTTGSLYQATKQPITIAAMTTDPLNHGLNATTGSSGTGVYCRPRSYQRRPREGR